MADLINKIQSSAISSNIAKVIFTKLWAGEDNVDRIIEREGYQQINDSSALEELIKQLIQKQTADYKADKEKLLGFFVGLVMKETKGQANPDQVNQLLKDFLLR